MPKKQILAISGSTRQHSSNQKVLTLVAESLSDSCHIEFYESIALLPHFNPDLDKEPLPAAVSEFRAKLEKADGVLICTPEYVFSLPGSLKNALEWEVSTMIFTEKPTAFIVAAGSGHQAYESLDLVLKTIGCKMTEDCKLLLSGIRGKFNSEGELIDPQVKAQLHALAQAFKVLMD